MIKKLFLSYSNRFVSRWLILVVDLFVVALAFSFSYLLRFNFDITDIRWNEFQVHLPFVAFIYTLGFVYFNSYSGVIRHTSIYDAVRVFRSTTASVFFLVVLSLVLNYLSKQTSVFYVPVSIAIIHYLITTFVLLSSRVIVKLAYFRITGSNVKKKSVLIYGVGQSGIITKNTLANDTDINYKIVGFLDDNPSKVGKHIEGIMVFSTKKLEYLIEDKNIETVVISVQNISGPRKGSFIDRCLALNVEVKNVPTVDRWINGELSARQIKNIRIEDLLQRAPIELDKKNVKEELTGKTILVTGAAGSIGTEIARQIMHYSPKMVLFLDQAESAIYEVEFDIKSKYKHQDNYRFIIADIRNKIRLNSIFKQYKPDLVFHAAAYKHVPLMENNPTEGVGVNVFGTKNLADLSIEYGVKKFVMVSTDKAVNPTNVMGATKRAAEIYTQALQKLDTVKTKFITTRFGNVLGSNGSVIPLFRKQIEKGGPIKVTHPEITRYFMTIPEACQLVLEAGAMGQGGEIFIFDMGESVKIIDVAKKMIQLSGLELGRDISIDIVGLRPGEKLYEELLNVKENTTETHHPKIMIGQVQEYDFDYVKEQLGEIKLAHSQMNPMEMVKELKRLIPEYKSMNSKFEAIDHEMAQERENKGLDKSKS